MTTTTAKKSRTQTVAAPTTEFVPVMPETTVNRAELKAALADVGRATSERGMPVLATVRIEAWGDSLSLFATDLEVGLERTLSAKTNDGWTLCVPAKLFLDVVGDLPGETITLHYNAADESLKIVAEGFEINIKGIPADEFPHVPANDGKRTFAMPAHKLANAIEAVESFAATDISRPVLTGVRFCVKGTNLTLAAADGFQLSRVQVELTSPAFSFDVIIPAGPLAEMGKMIAKEDGEVYITLADNDSNIAFSIEKAFGVSRLIDGKYPDVERVIRSTSETSFTVQIDQLARGAKLAKLLSNVVSGTVDETVFTLAIADPEVGNQKNELPITEKTGAGLTIGFDIRYIAHIAKAASAIGATHLKVGLETPRSALVLHPNGEGNEHTVFVVMPMTLK